MTEWTVITIIIALIGLFATVTAPIIKLMSTITKLSCSVDDLQKDLNSLTTKNSETHAKLFNEIGKQDERLDGHDRRIENHELRIKAVEGKK